MELRATQAALNRASAPAWTAFETHRTRVTDLLMDAPAGGRLWVMGAGNCNDLDLPRLLGRFAEVRLLDLDESAMTAGAARQGVAQEPRLLTEVLDLSGMLETMESWTPETPLLPSYFEACESAPLEAAPRLAGSEPDLLASVCLLSQIIQTAAAAVGEAHPQFLQLVQALRRGHLRLLAGLARPGGRVLLITDVVSSDTCPELAEATDLPGLLARLVNARNFFTGLNPAVLFQSFSTDPLLRAQMAEPRLLQPWVWDLGPRRYAVVAVQARRA